LKQFKWMLILLLSGAQTHMTFLTNENGTALFVFKYIRNVVFIKYTLIQ